ncbi:MAG: 3-deoxy-manno-octulosonate cytidylyltransferase [Candidatus Doudnabacteria bacterium]|nr:3-deoxy-manno-octulosonate cytidylyltransferase [Candidatus Doudnabacteria bacterium]
MRAVAIIPARFGSVRFPGKPLIDLNGKTLVQRVWEAAMAATTLDRVIVATDDERIASHCENIGAEYIITSSDLSTGTDRVAAAYSALNIQADTILNIQGDEPLLLPILVDQLVLALENSTADVATPIKKITSNDELFNPTIVKVALRNDFTALYFSRCTIPYYRGIEPEMWLSKYQYWKHIGLYAYRPHVLQRFVELPQSPLEIAESLEQLRLFTDGAVFQCVETECELIAVDTPEDAERVRMFL